MTFLEAALEILKRERKPLHYKDLTERAMDRKLLTFVGRTPEVTMQTQLTNAVKKAPGSPFVRVKPGIFGLLRYPEGAPEPEPEPEAPRAASPEARPVAAAAGAEASDREGRRRRRGGRGRGRPERTEQTTASAGGAMSSQSSDSPDEERDLAEHPEEPQVGSMSPEARAAALAETGVLDDEEAEGDEDEGDEEVEAAGAPGVEEEGDAAPGAEAGAEGAAPGAFEEGGPGRRRRRRRRRRGGAVGENGAPAGESPAPSESASLEGGAPAAEALSGDAGPSTEAQADAAQTGRRIMSSLDAAIEILKGQSPGRGVHVRQIADAAVRRRLVHGEPNEAWRVMRAALATEPRERLRQGLRPRVRPAGSGLYALSRRPPDMDLEKSEYVFGEARRALRERTLASLEQRLAELSGSAFEAVTRVLLQREGFGPATFVKRVEGTVYLEALRGRGSRPSRCLIALRSTGAPAGRRAIGELRAGIRARNQEEGLLMLAGRLAEDGIAEWRAPGSPVEVIDGAALADSCVRHGIGVVNATISVDFVDADFFAELSEG